MNERKLFLIDAMALIYRSFYALNKNPRVTSKGMNVSAILGFCNTLFDIITRYKPTHIGIAFDLQGATFRHEQFDEYKANRQAMPEEIRDSVPYIKDLIEAMNIPVLSLEKYEADDIIGTISKKAAKQGFEVFMVTPDKDYAQLVGNGIYMLKLGTMGREDQIWDVEQVLKRFEIKRPEQVTDILGLWGDSSDNIPGVPTIGEKKAKALMQQFDSIEDIIANKDSISSAPIRKAIENNAELALQSKHLATIVTDAPIEFEEESLRLSMPDINKCNRIFEELEFRTFAKRFNEYYSNVKNAHQADLFSVNEGLFKQQALFEQSSLNNIDKIECDYELVEDIDNLERIVNILKTKDVIAFDTETTGLEIDDSIIGISLVYEKNRGYFVIISDEVEKRDKQFNLLRQIFEDQDIEKVGHNIKFDKNILLNCGIDVKGKCFDTLVAHYLLEPQSRHKLDILSENYLGYSMIPFEAVFGKQHKGSKISIKGLNKSLLKDYAVEDADISFQLKDIFFEKLQENSLMDLFLNIEMPLVDVLLSMEREGVRIDTDELEQFSQVLSKRKTELEEQIYTLANKRFNIASTKQLAEVLFEELQIDSDKKAKKTSKKQYSTAEDVLQKLLNTHPIVALILEYRSLTKLKGTYVDALPLLVNGKTGKIHTSYNQAVTVTGRLSSTNPNLQNIPIITELGKEIRRCFVPSSQEYVLLSADYSQIELRIIASLSGDEHLCKAFNDREDIHLATAAKIYGVDKSAVSKDMRRNAKSVNFGIIYGISPFGLSEQLNISRREAYELIKQYFDSYPRVNQYIQQCIEEARERGYALSMCGRRRYLPDINSANANLRNFAQRNAVNMPIQATSADMIKIAMIRIYNQFMEEGLKSRMILQVHDELVFDVYKPELERVRSIVSEQMKNAIKLNVPIEVDINEGNNWLEAH